MKRMNLLCTRSMGGGGALSSTSPPPLFSAFAGATFFPLSERRGLGGARKCRLGEKQEGGRKSPSPFSPATLSFPTGAFFCPLPSSSSSLAVREGGECFFFLPGCSKESLLPPLGLGRQDETDIMHEKKERKKAWGEGRTAKSIALV